MTSRPFRFAVQAFNASSGKEWRDKARQAEALGYSTLHLADHVIGPGPAIAATRHPVQQLAAVPAIMSAAEATTTLRVGCRVFCVDYHHPVVLVKTAATIDLLSDGRLEFGLGAGWLAGEYEAMGIAMDPPGVRIERLAEVIGLARTLFAASRVRPARPDTAARRSWWAAAADGCWSWPPGPRTSSASTSTTAPG